MVRLNKIVNSAASVVFMSLAFGANPVAAQSTEGQEQLERDLTVAQKPLFQFVQQWLLQPAEQKLEVDAWVDRPSSIYRIGEKVKLMVRPRQDSYITVVDVGTSGKVTVLYPNHYQKDARVRANTTLMVPGDSAKWAINVGGPAGVDIIHVISSRQPLSLPEVNALVKTSANNPFPTLGRSSEEFTRDLSVQAKPPVAAPGKPVPQPNFGLRNVLIRVVAANAGAPAMQPSAQGTLVATMPSGSNYNLVVKPEKPVYRVGESIRVLVSSENDCRLTLMNVSGNGHVVRLFPNSYQKNDLIRTGQIVTIPAPQSGLNLVAKAPGVEGLVATCRAIQSAATPGESQPGFAVGSIQTVSRELTAISEDQSGATGEQASGSYMVVE